MNSKRQVAAIFSHEKEKKKRTLVLTLLGNIKNSIQVWSGFPINFNNPLMRIQTISISWTPVTPSEKFYNLPQVLDTLKKKISLVKVTARGRLYKYCSKFQLDMKEESTGWPRLQG